MKQIKINRKFVTLFTGIFFAFFIFSGGMSVSAQSANEKCNFKANKNLCIQAYDDCKGAPTCVDRIDNQVAIKTSFGGNIYLYCQIQSTPFAQNCHRTVQAECGGDTTCKKNRANALAVAAGLTPFTPSPTAAVDSSPISLSEKNIKKGTPCGRDTATTKAVNIQFDIGCKQKADSPIVDMAYALIKFLTIGVGLVLVISIIFAGIMYTTSGGSPEQTSKAKDRILNAMIGLIFYLLISAFANFLIPGGLF